MRFKRRQVRAGCKRKEVAHRLGVSKSFIYLEIQRGERRKRACISLALAQAVQY